MSGAARPVEHKAVHCPGWLDQAKTQILVFWSQATSAGNAKASWAGRADVLSCDVLVDLAGGAEQRPVWSR